MIEKLTNIVVTLAVILSITAGVMCLFQHRWNYMDRYAAEHNCRWDYNDMCYTIDERPWLYND